MDWGRVVGILIGLLFSLPCWLWLVWRLLVARLKVFQVRTRRVPPSCLQDPQYGRHHYVKVRGVKLHYVEAGVEGEEDKEKPVMLFCHGFPEFWFVWRHQITHFKDKFRVIAIDNRGYGESEKPTDLDKYHVKELADDIKGLVESLGVRRFTLVGHDWGGLISWTFASLYPDMLDNLIILNSPHSVALSEAGIGQKLFHTCYVSLFQVPWLPELFALSEDVKFLEIALGGAGLTTEELEAYKYSFRNFRAWTGPINLYRASFTEKTAKFWASDEMKRRIRKIDVRTLHIFGTNDDFLPLSAAKNSEKYVPDYQLRLLEGVSHWVQHEASDRANTIMEEFLESAT